MSVPPHVADASDCGDVSAGVATDENQVGAQAGDDATAVVRPKASAGASVAPVSASAGLYAALNQQCEFVVEAGAERGTGVGGVVAIRVEVNYSRD